MEVKQAKCQQEFERKLQEVAKRDQNFISKLKTKLSETEQQHKELDEEVKALHERITAFKEEKARLGMTDEVQEQEIERLMSERDGNGGQGEGANAMLRAHTDGLQFQKVQQRANSLEHRCTEVEMERNRLIQENANNKENLLKVQKALNDEIDALKERENQLKVTNALLEKGLEDQRRANLDTVAASSRADDGGQEKYLILEERAAKSEAETEKMRAERLLAIEELNKEKQKLINLQVQISNHELENNTLKEQLTQQSTQLKHLEELNKENHVLKQEKSQLLEKLTKQQADVAKANLIQQELEMQDLTQMKSQLDLVKKAFAELQQSVQTDKDNAQNTEQP